VVELIRKFADLGHKIVAILPRPLTPVTFPRSVNFSYVYPWNFQWYGIMVFNFLAGLRIIHHLLLWKPDCVYLREAGSNPLPAFLCRVFRVPFFVEINGYILDHFPRIGASRVRIAIERQLQAYELNQSTGIILSSDRRRSRLLHDYALSPDHCAFLLNGFTAEVFSPGDRSAARVKLQLDHDVFALVFVGSLGVAYDFSNYFSLIKRLKKLFPQLVFWIVGDGPLRLQWEEQVHALGIEHKVKFVGYQSEEVASDWIRAGNLCLAPHTASGLAAHGAITSTKLWAYAACGRAILLHYDPAYPSPHEYLHLFRLVPPQDEEAIESAIRIGIGHPNELDEEGAANCSWVTQNASWAHTARSTIQFMQRRMNDDLNRTIGDGALRNSFRSRNLK